MKSTDNMGGFLSADFILQYELESFISSGTNYMTTLKENSEWKSLHTKQQGISLTIKPDKKDPGLLYDISGSVVIKKSCPWLDILRLHTLILIRVQLADNSWRILGTDEYPLQATIKPLTPTKASGFAGYELSFKGQQLFEPPFLT